MPMSEAFLESASASVSTSVDDVQAGFHPPPGPPQSLSNPLSLAPLLVTFNISCGHVACLHPHYPHPVCPNLAQLPAVEVIVYCLIAFTTVAMLAGKQLANAAVSLRVTSDGGSSSSSTIKSGSSHAKLGSRQGQENTVSTQKALDLLDVNDAQAGEYASRVSSHNTAAVRKGWTNILGNNGRSEEGLGGGGGCGQRVKG